MRPLLPAVVVGVLALLIPVGMLIMVGLVRLAEVIFS